jgi:hypothetical protein
MGRDHSVECPNCGCHYGGLLDPRTECPCCNDGIYDAIRALATGHPKGGDMSKPVRTIVARVLHEEMGMECLEGYWPMPVSEALVAAGAADMKGALDEALAEVRQLQDAADGRCESCIAVGREQGAADMKARIVAFLRELAPMVHADQTRALLHVAHDIESGALDAEDKS